MSPRPKVDHLRKPQIIAAATEVFYERGLLDARIGDIAKRAGTSSPTVLYYFESKDRLFEEVVDSADREFYSRLTAGQACHDRASEKLVHLIEQSSLADDAVSDYTLWMDFWGRARRDHGVRQKYFRLNRRERDLIADIVKEGQASGEFDRAADPDEFAMTISALMDGLGVQVTLGEPSVTAERMLSRCLALASAELGCDFRAATDRSGRESRGEINDHDVNYCLER